VENAKAVDKYTFIEYTNLPGVLGERVFSIFDDNGDSVLDAREFVNGLFKIYYSSFESKLRFVFDL